MKGSCDFKVTYFIKNLNPPIMHNKLIFKTIFKL